MGAAAIEIAGAVFLELEAIDNEGRGSFRFCGGLVFVFFLSGFGGCGANF